MFSEFFLLFFLCTFSYLFLYLGCPGLYLCLYCTTHNTNICAFRGIRTRNPSKRAATSLRLRPLSHWDGLGFEPEIWACERPQILALDSAATGIGRTRNLLAFGAVPQARALPRAAKYCTVLTSFMSTRPTVLRLPFSRSCSKMN